MTVDSMEALEALAPGAMIKVTSARVASEWVLNDQGQWTRGEAVLPPSMFTGLVDNGRVEDLTRTPPEPGAWYRSRQRQYFYLVFAVENQSIGLMRFRRSGSYASTVHYSLLDMQSLYRMSEDERPEWCGPVWGAVQSRQQLVEQSQQMLRDQTTNLQEAQEQLHVLEQLRLDRPGVVNVTVTGTSQVPTDKADGHVPAAAQVDSVVARWRATLQLETRGAGCLCPQASATWVREQLGINPDEPSGMFEYTTDCGRHEDA